MRRNRIRSFIPISAIRSGDCVSGVTRFCGVRRESRSFWNIVQAFGSDLELEPVNDLRDIPRDTDENPFTVREFTFDSG